VHFIHSIRKKKNKDAKGVIGNHRPKKDRQNKKKKDRKWSTKHYTEN